MHQAKATAYCMLLTSQTLKTIVSLRYWAEAYTVTLKWVKCVFLHRDVLSTNIVKLIKPRSSQSWIRSQLLFPVEICNFL